MSLLVEIATLVLAVVVVYILWKLLENVGHLIINSIMGIIVFWALNQFFGLGIPIYWLSVLVVAIAGLPGVLLVVLIHFLGLGF
jgi:hypothetical protein